MGVGACVCVCGGGAIAIVDTHDCRRDPSVEAISCSKLNSIFDPFTES